MAKGTLRYEPTKRFLREMERNGIPISEADKHILTAIEARQIVSPSVIEERNKTVISDRLAALEREKAALEANL